MVEGNKRDFSWSELSERNVTQGGNMEGTTVTIRVTVKGNESR
jgi:hypothetical protein